MRLGLRITPEILEKAHRNMPKLEQKVIIDKNGHKKTVYVKLANMEKKGRPSNLKNTIHTILYGPEDKKAKLVKHHFFMADTPLFMKDLGLKGDFFSVRYGVITRHKTKDSNHNLSEQNWIDLCEAIVKPFAIAKHKEGYRLFTGIKVDEDYIAVGIDVKNVGKNILVNSVATAFCFKAKQIASEIIYIDKKISPDQKAVLRKLNSSQYPFGQGFDRYGHPS